MEEEEEALIQEYLNSNSTLAFELKPSGLYYLETLAGTGLLPESYDTVFVKYTGKFLNGSVFDPNVGTTTTYDFVIDKNFNIIGFNEGISYMKEGGKAIILIPSKLGYGTMGSYPYINGYTPLIFELELVKVSPGPGK